MVNQKTYDYQLYANLTNSDIPGMEEQPSNEGYWNIEEIHSLQNELINDISKGNDLQSLSNIIYKQTNLPFIIEDRNFHVLAFSGITEGFFNEIDSDFNRYLQREMKFPSKTQPFSSVTEINADLHYRLIAPILIEEKIYGYCSFVFFSEHVNQHRVNPEILEKIASVCALSLIKIKTSYEVISQTKSYFFKQMLDGDLSKDEILKRSSYIDYHLNLDQPFHIVLLKYEGNIDRGMIDYNKISQHSEEYLRQNKWNFLFCQKLNHLAFLIQPNSKSFKDIIDCFKEMINYLIITFPQLTFHVGISSESDQIDQVFEQYDEAIIASQIPSKKAVTTFESLGIIGILISSKNELAIKRYAKQLLGPLLNIDESKNKELIKTLFVYLVHGGKIENTAHDLSLSLNGLRYRIEKIEMLLEKDFRNPVIAYQYLLTLQALTIMGEIEV
ncbi:helix-turn-helix domain-containing protein [Sporosarcina sp. ACRSM]|uniref:PucR family transcriptional regulator n=1 Tax=Sporosarcina sp. ACRSM TaxID=2918216 RepID=UPI001EF3F1C8|nr:helix-turn-helix domain-containing protein [Sporosarcina sp. ACRSM]MCG7335228.1 helix-turn-helix domain-containing protein [Sporosarcina sp. ACRSM]